MIKTELILEFIKNNKLTKACFCKGAGISVYTLNKILKSGGRCRVGVIIALKIARFMNIRLSELVGKP